MVTRRDCPGMAAPRTHSVPQAGRKDAETTGAGLELIGVMITKVHAGFMLGVGGTIALTPPLSRSGKGEFSATRRPGGRARLARGLAAEIRELPESRGDFVWHEVGGEMVTRQDCPEFARGGSDRKGGVKALPMHRERSPRPGGLCGGLEHGEHPWGLRRGVSTTDGGLAGMRRRMKWGWGFDWHDIGGEMLTRRECPEYSDSKTGCARGNWRGRRWAATDVGDSRKRAGLCHPAGVEDLSLGYPGVSRGATPGHSNGIPSGCGKAPPRTLFAWDEDGGGRTGRSYRSWRDWCRCLRPTHRANGGLGSAVPAGHQRRVGDPPRHAVAARLGIGPNRVLPGVFL